jgi:uncharacterized protein YcaQ
MSKGTYSGGGTTVRLGEEGTIWDRQDEAENEKRHSRTWDEDNKRPTIKQIDAATEHESLEERNLLRSFISQCATAYATGKLTAEHPLAPKSLRKRVRNAGGNIKWLEGHRLFQNLFHQAYCRVRNEDVPFEKVWGPPAK